MYCSDKNLVQQTMFLFSRADKLEQSKRNFYYSFLCSTQTWPHNLVVTLVAFVEASPEEIREALSVALEQGLVVVLAEKRQSPVLVE